jgi:predicted dehydrogenase
MDRLRTALIGCGKVGQIHAAALRSLPESEFVAACDPQRERAEAFAALHGTRAFADVATMLAETKAQAVVIGTPHPLHAAAAIAAMEAGVHVLVEKPMAASLTDCDAMLETASRTGMTLGIVSQRRFYEPVQRLKEAIALGKIGKPVLGIFQMFSWRDRAYYQSDAWRGKWATEGGGVLVNQSPHQLDLLQWLMGDIEEVCGYWSNFNHPEIEVEDSAVASLRFRGGGLGSIVTSLSQKPGLFTRVHIHGSNGASVGVETDRGATFVAGMTEIAEPPLNDLWTISGEEDALTRFQAEDRARFRQIEATTYYHGLQIQDFLRAIIDGRPPLVTGADGRKVVALFTAIYRSQRDHRPIAFPPPAVEESAPRAPAAKRR